MRDSPINFAAGSPRRLNEIFKIVRVELDLRASPSDCTPSTMLFF
uniref:Uncharacterized protein n=1 Tax=Arcella intermedia TaxID=1963864 RepID=A0A6B2LXS7_9EUKA